jgi:hypothetical protein
MPFGPRSRAITCARPRIANFAGPKAAEAADGFAPAVAPVKENCAAAGSEHRRNNLLRA